jgi:RNA polymerase sigma-70 factor (ECF subfamily)
MLHGFSNDSADAAASPAARGAALDVSLTGAAPASSAADAAPEVSSRDARARHFSDDRLVEWFRDHFDTVWRFAARLGVPRQHVDDVVQEVFITASRRAVSIASGAERRFLIAVTIKIAANQRRRVARQLDRPGLVEEHADVGGDGAVLLERKRELEMFYAALDALPYEQRSAFVLHELEGFTVPQIAELLDIPQGTAASRLGRARRGFAKSAERLRSLASKGERP